MPSDSIHSAHRPDHQSHSQISVLPPNHNGLLLLAPGATPTSRATPHRPSSDAYNFNLTTALLRSITRHHRRRRLLLSRDIHHLPTLVSRQPLFALNSTRTPLCHRALSRSPNQHRPHLLPNRQAPHPRCAPAHHDRIPRPSRARRPPLLPLPHVPCARNTRCAAPAVLIAREPHNCRGRCGAGGRS